MRKFLVIFSAVFFFLISNQTTSAQEIAIGPTETPIASQSATATASAKPSNVFETQIDLTSPDQAQAQQEFLKIYKKRPINNPTVLNIFAYLVQYAVRAGVPVNTIILILLLPFLATLVVFARQIIGVPTLEMLVPIALSITLVATGLKIGAILLFAILAASILSRILLKKIRIMQLPKMALSMFLVSLSVLLALIVTASFGLLPISKLSFLPVILMILLSDKVVALELARGVRPTIVITFFTLLLGAIGYFALVFEPLRNFILIYPESALIVIPIDILFGRYFGLRLTEFQRFAKLRQYANK